MQFGRGRRYGFGRFGQFIEDPSTIAEGLLFWGDVKNTSRTTWNTAGYQINNNVATLPPKVWHQGMDFTSTNNDYVNFGDVGVVAHIGFWINLDTTTEPIMTFRTSSISMEVSTGTIIFNGGITPTVKVDGVATSTITTGWHFLEVIFDTPLDCTTFTLGQVNGAVYGDFKAKDLICLSAENTSLYGTTDIIALSNKVLVTPLADYSVADGARTAGDIVLDYSGNGNHGTIQGTSVTPVYTPVIGHEVSEDSRNRYMWGNRSVYLTLDETLTTGKSVNGYIEFECVLPVLTANDGLLYSIAGVNTTEHISLEDDTGGKIWYFSSTGGDKVWSEGTAPGISSYFDGNIHLLCFQVTDGNLSLIIDGNTLGTDTAGTFYVIDILTLGSRGGATPFIDALVNIDYNGTTIAYGNENNGTISGTESYINVFSTGATDLFGDTIPTFTGAAAPDGKLYTGGAIDFTAANSDYVTIGNLGTIRRVSFWIKLDTTSEDILQLSSTVYLTASSGTLAVAGTTAETIYVNTVETATIGTSWSYVNITFSEDITADDVEIGRQNTSYGDFSIKDIQFYSTAVSDTVYNLPNSFVANAQSNCVAAYDFNQGTYSAGSPVIDVSGNNNHGTVQGATAEMALNNIEVGSQTALHGWSLYGLGTSEGVASTTGTSMTGGVGADFSGYVAGDYIWANGELREIASVEAPDALTLVSAFSSDLASDSIIHLDQDEGANNLLIPSTTDTSTTDIFGNTVQRAWKAGVLNFSSFDHDGMLVGTTGDFDAPQYSIMALYLMKSVSTVKQILLSNRTTGDGITYSILATELADLENEESATAANDSADTTLVAGTNYVLAVDVQPDGTTEHFDGTDLVVMVSDSTATQLRTSVGQASTALRIGALNDGTLPVNEAAISILLMNQKQPLATKEKLRKYLIKLIP